MHNLDYKDKIHNYDLLIRLNNNTTVIHWSDLRSDNTFLKFTFKSLFITESI